MAARKNKSFLSRWYTQVTQMESNMCILQQRKTTSTSSMPKQELSSGREISTFLSQLRILVDVSVSINKCIQLDQALTAHRADINPYVGVTATGVIDPMTDTWYLTSKTYADESATGAKGRINGRYYFHAINVNDLSENRGFPTVNEGLPARNNPLKPFEAGIHHQRPALLHTGQYVYAGFASHCAQYNFTGWIMGWDKTNGNIVEHYAMEGGKSRV